jgi:GNAT superfamily N-acetyltransferase
MKGSDHPGLEGPRGVRPAELPALLDLLNSVFRPQTRSMAREHGYMYCRENGEHLRVMLANGIPVSHYGTKLWTVSCLGVPLLQASVGGVCTLPDFRGQGLATVLLKDAESLFRRTGVDLVLISGGRGLYLTNGHGKAGRCLRYELDSRTAARLATGDVSIRPFKPRDLRTLAAIAEREPVRYERPLDELARLVEGRLARIVPDRFFIVSCASRDVAWFDIMTSFDGTILTLWDCAGDRAAVLAGLGRFMRAHSIKRITVPVPAHDAALAGRLGAVAKARTEELPEHTVKILDFKGFMDKVRPILAQRVGHKTLAAIRFRNAGAGGIISAGRTTFRMPGSQDVVQRVFGSADRTLPEVPDAAGTVIREFMAAAFPLPLVWPGINYV